MPEPIKGKVGIPMTNKLELIDKAKLLATLRERRDYLAAQFEYWQENRKLESQLETRGMSLELRGFIDAIESGTFDIKEPIQEEGEKAE
jgi:hypothetical protein